MIRTDELDRPNVKQPIEVIADELNGTIIGYWNGDHVLIQTVTRYYYYRFRKIPGNPIKQWVCTQSFNKLKGSYIP